MAVKSIVQASSHPWMKMMLRLCSDKTYFRVKWWARRMPYRLDLKNPQTFNAKLQWIKLYDRNPLYTTLVDKYRVKQYVTERVGADHVIPLLGAWDSVDDIEWEKLPSQFVLKVNHDCGGQVICKDKSKLNIDEAREKLRNAFATFTKDGNGPTRMCSPRCLPRHIWRMSMESCATTSSSASTEK